MRITVSMPSTGFVFAPGLARPVVIDVDALPAAEAANLKALAQDAGVFDAAAPLTIPADPKTRDAREVVIDVEDGSRRRMLRIAEPSPLAPPLQRFVDAVRAQADALRAAGSPK